MKLLEKLTNLPRFMVATGVAYMSTIGSASADANRNLSDVTDQLTESLNGLPVLFTSAAYIIGIGFVIAGLFKLKEFVDDPSQGDMKNALIRLGVGALMILLPFAIEVSSGTLGADGGNSVDFQGNQFDNTFN